jgi:glycosyltransferase involved in cell wall biosynthesis
MAPCLDGTHISSSDGTVAVIIPTFNHARFLARAIDSVLAQTRSVDEIIVVDDGSDDNPAGVVSQYPDVQFIRQINRGPSAARNVGLRYSSATYVTFLDADDQFLPAAVESGLNCILQHPEFALVYGGYRFISENGRAIGPDYFYPIEGDAHIALLKANRIVMHATVLYRRCRLLEINGFDETLRRGEDYDVYLRIAKNWEIGSHPATVAEYRRHGGNVSGDFFAMLDAVLSVVDRHEACLGSDPLAHAALREGRINRRKHYVSEALASAKSRWTTDHDLRALMTDYIRAARWDPIFTLRVVLGPVGLRVSKILPPLIVRGMERMRGRPYS